MTREQMIDRAVVRAIKRFGDAQIEWWEAHFHGAVYTGYVDTLRVLVTAEFRQVERMARMFGVK